jgi:MFS family permease
VSGEEKKMSRNVAAEAKLGGAMAWWVWILSVTFVVYLFSFQTGYAIVSPSVQQEVGLSAVQVGTIAAVYTWIFAIFQFFGGALLDRLGARKVLPVSIALVTLGVFLFANASSYQGLLVSQFVLALGSCTGFVGAGYIGGQWFGMARFSFMFGLVQFTAALTSAFTQNLIDFSLQHIAWRQLFNGVGVFGVLLFALGAVFIRNPKPVEAPAAAGGMGAFFASVLGGMARVARIGHVWVASINGAAAFGAMLALGVVWGPKLLMVHGVEASTANFGASMLWLGLAAGCLIVPRWSDAIRRRKLPILVGTAVQLVCLLALLYLPSVGTVLGMALCFTFGFANAAHMLAFSTVADVVAPSQIGTSAAIVNGIMFIVGGVLIARPGVLGSRAIERGVEVGTLELAQIAGRPLVMGLVLAVVLALVMAETYPGSRKDEVDEGPR